MNPKKINKVYLMNLTFTADNFKNKTHRLNRLLPLKPNFLKASKISKMLDFTSLYKKCNMNSDSLCEKNDSITKNKIENIYVKKNNSITLNERVINSNKENINLNNKNEFKTIIKIKINKNQKQEMNAKLKKNIENKNSLLKNYNLEDLEKIKELIHKNNNTCRKERDKDTIKSKISELSSLKKLIFKNNNFQFFKKMSRSRTNNIQRITNTLNKRNTINYFNKYKKHIKTKKEDIYNIYNRCITKHSKIINYTNSNQIYITKKKSRNCKFNNNYYVTESNITIDERNRTNYMGELEKNFENNNYINDNINGEIKLFNQKIKKEKIISNIKLMKKINHETKTQSQISSNKTKNFIKINKTPLIDKEKILKKIKKLNIIKKVIKIDSCTVPGKSSQTNLLKINKSNYSVKKEFLNKKDNFLLIIGDGYGPYGHLISKYFCDILPTKITNISKENIEQSFLSTNNLLLTQSKIDCTLSGASITSIIITPDKILSANIGTCKGILVFFENEQYKIANLTKKYNINKNLPFLQSYYLKGNEKFILLGTNGLWEFIDNEESVKIIKFFYENGKDAKGALNTLVREAILRWNKEKNYVDDIAAILLFFD